MPVNELKPSNALQRKLSVLAVSGCLLLTLPLYANADHKGTDGENLLRMCRGANKVQALGVMCYSYVNGYLDTAHHFGKVHDCFKDSDKEMVPSMLEIWLQAHPDQLKAPAPEILNKAFAANYPCRK
jgi:hypothetical protein